MISHRLPVLALATTLSMAIGTLALAHSSGEQGDQTGLGRIGPESERERHAQERSDKAKESIFSTC